jgi:hypothetical protein
VASARRGHHGTVFRVALAAVAASLVAVVGAARAPAVLTLRLPSSAVFYTIEPLGGRLLLSASDTEGNGCAWLVVSPEPLRVRSSFHANCKRPAVAAEPAVPIQFPVPDSSDASLRIVRPNLSSSRVSVGPVVMTFNDVSDTKLEWTYGPGTLWVYDVAALNSAGRSPRAELLDISTTTGQVVRTVSMPSLVRPLLAADADGLWIAASPGTGAGTPAPIYHLAIGAAAPRVVHRGGYAALWLVAAGHTVWADIGTIPPHSSASTAIHQEIWRFDGPSAPAHALAGANGLNSSATPTVQAGAAALWTLSLIPSPPGSYYACTHAQLVRIDARTGRQTVTRTLSFTDEYCLPVQGQAFVDGAFYFLSPYISPATRTTLYRLRT